MFQGWKGITVIVVCLAVLFGVGVIAHIDSAWVALIASVTTLLAYVTRSPASPPPPTPPSAGAALLLLAGCAFAVEESGCASLAAQKAEAEAAYGGELLQCVDKSATRAEADTCREAVRQRWGIADAQTAADGGTR